LEDRIQEARLVSLARREATFWLEMWRATPAPAAGSLILVLLAAVASYGVMMGSALLVESLVHRDGGAWTWLAITAGSLVVQSLSSIVLEATGAANQAGMTVRAHDLVARAALAPHGVEHLEDPRAAADLRGAAHHIRDSLQLDAVSEVWRWLAIRVRGLAALVVIGHWSWVAAAIVAGAQMLNSRSMMGYLKAVQDDILQQSADEGRRASYVWSLLLTRQAGKEVRLFGLTDWLLGRYAEIWRDAETGILARRTAAVRPVYASSLVLTLATLSALFWLASDVWHGHVSIATMVAAAQGIAGLRAFGNLGDTLVQVTRARSSALAAHRLGGALAPTPDEAVTAVATACDVRFDNVTFGYPARSTPVFENLSLHIPAGQSVAVVGVNGVGKSTMIKLLCGLYRPNAGTVTVDGRDPGTDNAARRRVAVIFQDFVRYQLSLRDNVAMPLLGGTRPITEVEAATARALRDAAAGDILDRFGGDWSTVLDPGYEGGSDLSGGQWQRVALARALTAVEAGAGVLVLDEPTAALDVRAEAEIFSRFLQVTRGVTSILVSHRLSSVRHAERIVVLGSHGVLEDGSHEQLLAAGGLYADMFTLQASRFVAAAGQETGHA
jgi:ATP-binding cassette subfamily B protein